MMLLQLRVSQTLAAWHVWLPHIPPLVLHRVGVGRQLPGSHRIELFDDETDTGESRNCPLSTEEGFPLSISSSDIISLGLGQNAYV